MGAAGPNDSWRMPTEAGTPHSLPFSRREKGVCPQNNMGAGVAASPRSPRLPIAPPRPGDHPLGGWVPERGVTSFGSPGSRTERERSGASRRQGFGPKPAAPPGGSTGGRTLPFRLARGEGEPPSLTAVRDRGEPFSLPWLEAEASFGLPPPPRVVRGQARSQPFEGRVP